jgi:hypothetical protein
MNVNAMHDARKKKKINMARQDNNGMDLNS